MARASTIRMQLSCLVFAGAMILAGRCQDKFGPRITASIGGLLVGAGFYISSMSTGYWIWLLGFGVIFGLGMGFGYSSATPPALKWFPPSKTGLIAGLVVAGFGLAPVYLAPLTDHLLKFGTGSEGVLHAMKVYSVLFTVVVVGLAQFLVNPPPEFSHKPDPGAAPRTAAPAGGRLPKSSGSPASGCLWLIYFIGSGAGLMVISSVSGMAKKSMGRSPSSPSRSWPWEMRAGASLAGILSDKIGRRRTLFLVLAVQAALMFAAIPITASKDTLPFVVVALAALIGANYGANLSLFPSLTKDLWGLKSFGMNYGTLFTAWGVGGLILPLLQQRLFEASAGATGIKNYASSFQTAAALLIAGAVLTFLIKPPQK